MSISANGAELEAGVQHVEDLIRYAQKEGLKAPYLPNQYYVLESNPELLLQAYDFVMENPTSQYAVTLVHALWVNQLADPETLSLQEIRAMVEHVELLQGLDDRKHQDLIEKSYKLMAFSGDHQAAFSFLKSRIGGAYAGAEEPHLVYHDSDTPWGLEVDPAYAAIFSMGELPLDEAREFIQMSLQSETDESRRFAFEIATRLAGDFDSILRRIIEAQSEKSGEPFDVDGRYAQYHAFAEAGKAFEIDPIIRHLALQQEAAAREGEIAKEDSGEITTEPPVEATPVEVAEAAPEQSSQWWLWLIGALVVLGGLGLLLRRKR